MSLVSSNISKKYFNKTVLNSVSFNIEPGNIYAMLGPNGSGKTTWMKIASCLTKPSAGEISLNGKSIGQDTKKEIAYMPTEPYFYDWMTVKDTKKYYMDFFDDFDESIFVELLEKMELTENLKCKNLSSGMTAKLKIALALSRKVKVYLLDEPLNGIDLIARDTVMNTIISCLSEDVALVVSSHLVEELEAFANKAVFIKNGDLLDICDIETLRMEQGKSLADRYRELMN